VWLATRVNAVWQQSGGDGYVVEAEGITVKARNAVLATGPYQKPKLPTASAALSPDICQLHSSEYRNPQMLPSGAVLVVGTGQSGWQIAEDLYESGRQVYLSTSSCGRAPRGYRGKDTAWWLTSMGFFDMTPDQLPSPTARFECVPHISGNHGGDINLHSFVRQGVILLGHVQAAQGKQIILAPDLEENLARADAFERQIMQRIDEYIRKTAVEVETNRTTTDEVSSNGATATKPILTLDLQAAGISTINWASGYQLDFGWVQIAVFDRMGYPVHKRGITAFPGLYFLGLS
jgi:putative flavoprotein involved in K+ transport